MTHPMAAQLQGKVAIVTGAGRGIGRGIALVLAERGASVTVSDINAEAAAHVAGEIGAAGGHAIAVAADVTSQDSMNEVAERALNEFSQIDICVANAGVLGAPGHQDRMDYTDADWDSTYDVNVKGLVHTADAVIPHMKDRRYGKIINIASHAGRPPRGASSIAGTIQATYSVSKAAAIQWTHVLAISLGQYNINVNAVCPGTIWTPMWETIALNRKAHNPDLAHLSPKEIFDLSIRERMPLGRAQTPEDIGRAVAFLASDDASEITGQALNVNGGAIMS